MVCKPLYSRHISQVHLGQVAELGLVVLFKERIKEGNVLFNDTFHTFYLRLYGINHVVNDHLDSKRGNLQDYSY